MGGEFSLLCEQFFLLRQQLFLRLGQLLGLLLELARLFLSLTEQLLRPQVALQDFEAQGDHRQEFVQESLLARPDAAEPGGLPDAEQRALGKERDGGGMRRGSRAQAGRDAQVT